MTSPAAPWHWKQGNPVAQSGSVKILGLPAAECVAIVWFTILFILAIGIKNGELNQVFYLLHGLRRADPTFLQGDWYTNLATYHVPWNWLVAGLARAGLLEVGLTVGTVIMMVVFTVAVYAGMRSVYQRPLLPWALTLMFFAGLFTRGLGDMDLLPSSIEPFGIGGAAMVLGFAFLAWRRPLGAGISWGVGAFMHSHFALLLLGILILTTVFQARRVSPPYLLKLWIPFLVMAAPSLLRVYAFASAPGGARMYQILSEIAPQHYYPWGGDWKPFVLFGGASLMAVGGVIVRRPRWNPELFAPLAATALIVVGSLTLGWLGWFEFVRRGLPWRLSSFLMLVGVAAGAAALGDPRQGRLTSRDSAAWIVLLTGLGLFVLAGTSRLWLAVLAAVVVLLASVTTKRVISPHPQYRSALTLVPLLVVSLGMIPVAHKELGRSHTDIRPLDKTRLALYRWARDSTQPGSIFVALPGWKDFRLNTRRALVADWWAPPLYPPDFLRWYERIGDLTGIQHPKTLGDVESGYAQLDCKRVEFLYRRYDARYFVVEPEHSLPCGAVVYRDTAYEVVDHGR